MAFLRSKQQSDSPAEPGTPVTTDTDTTTGKGRPTPTRKESEAANKRPLVPTDRRSAARTAAPRGSKAAAREVRNREYAALKAGDERYLPAKDKGPERRFAREWVDARWNLAEFFLPVALVFFVAMIATSNANPAVSVVVLLALYLMVIAALVDAFIMWRSLRKRLTAKFGGVTRGTAFYAVMRAFQLRRFRLPKPMGPRGNRPA